MAKSRSQPFAATIDREAKSRASYHDGGTLLLATLFGMYPFLQKPFADGG
jgi:hypothetical protein